MKIFKIKHKPTGLYFTPSRGSGNLSLNGKIYPKYPSNWENWIKTIRIVLYRRNINKIPSHHLKIINYFNLDKIKTFINIYKKTSIDDWEVETI